MAGRFLTEDPIRDGLNWYAYCENNPIFFIDSSGLDPVPSWAKNINSGKGTAADFNKAIDVYFRGTVGAWAGSAGIQVEKAINSPATQLYLALYIEGTQRAAEYISTVANYQAWANVANIYSTECMFDWAINYALYGLPNVWDEQGYLLKQASDNLGTVSATADVRKFSEYIFKDGAAPGKDVIFKELGYTKNDSQILANLYKQQAAIKYDAKDYTLGKLDSFGQRINIEIILNGIGNATGKTSYIKSGWMIQPDGSISLNTPFTGFTR